MPFSEKIKLDVKHKANFRCCRCQSIGVQVHHITPEKNGGSDEFENAAPLCPSCHDYFGDNPSKRKEIKEMRDWWYQNAKQMFYPNPDLAKIEEKIDGLVLDLRENTDQIVNFKSTLKEYANILIDSVTPATSGSTATNFVNTPFPGLGSSAHDNIGISEFVKVKIDLSKDEDKT